MKKIVVVKFGGNALNAETAQDFCRVVAELPVLGFAPIIVHGGGPQIDAMLTALDVESHFVNGLRYTDDKTLSVVEMVLSGQVNKMLVQCLAQAKVAAVGISGKDGNTLVAEKWCQDDDGNTVDLGHVGEVKRVNPRLLKTLIDADFVPVLAPLALSSASCGGSTCNQTHSQTHSQTCHQTYNVNADYAAAAVASALNAAHFVMMTNIAGLLDGDGNVIHDTTSAVIYRLIDEGIIQGGMIPKTLSAIATLKTVGEVHIIDGRHAQNLTSALSGKAVGTTIRA